MKLNFILFIIMTFGLASCGLKKEVANLATQNKELKEKVASLVIENNAKQIELQYLQERIQGLENSNGNISSEDLPMENIILNSAEVMPMYTGEQSLNEFLDMAIAEMGANGNGKIVYVGMVVLENGELSQMKAVKSVTTVLDSQAVAALKKTSPWSPGFINGKNVKVRMVIPVTFK